MRGADAESTARPPVAARSDPGTDDRNTPSRAAETGEFLPDGSEILQVDTYPLTIYWAAAVQELRGVVRALEAEGDEREARIAELESRIEGIGERRVPMSGALAWPVLLAAGLGAGFFAARRGKEATR